MTVRLPTFSGIEAAARCAGSLVVERYDDVSEDAERGTLKHAFAEAVNTLGWGAAVDAAPPAIRAWVDALDPERFPEFSRAGGFASEVALVLDVATGEAREVGRSIGRKYPERGPTELAGTLDLVGLAGDGETVLALDIKTGRRQTPAFRHWQMRAAAVAAAAAYGRSRAIVALVYVAEDGERWDDVATFEAFDLAMAAAELRELVAEWHQQASAPRFVRGPHCRRCQGFDRCPAQRELLALAVQETHALTRGESASLGQQFEMALTQGARAEAYALWQSLQVLTKRLGQRIADHAAMRPIELPDGRLYGWAPGKEMVADAEKVHQVLVRHAGAAIAESAITTEVVTSATKGAITKAINKLPKTSRGAVWADLRRVGALERKVTPREYAAGESGEDDRG